MFEEFLTKQKKAFEEEKKILLKEKERQLDKNVGDFTRRYKLIFGLLGMFVSITSTLMAFIVVFPVTGSLLTTLIAAGLLVAASATAVMFVALKRFDVVVNNKVEEFLLPVRETERQCDKAVQDYENDFIRFTEKMASDFCDRIAESDFPHNVGRMRHSCDFSVYKDKIFSDSGSFIFKKYLESDSEIISLSQAIAQSIKAKVEEKMDSFIGKDKTVTINDMQSIEEPQASVAYMAYKE